MKHKNNNPAGTYLFKINNTLNKAMFIEFILLTLLLILDRYFPSANARNQTIIMQ